MSIKSPKRVVVSIWLVSPEGMGSIRKPSNAASRGKHGFPSISVALDPWPGGFKPDHDPSRTPLTSSMGRSISKI
jgi:hypothetical protein